MRVLHLYVCCVCLSWLLSSSRELRFPTLVSANGWQAAVGQCKLFSTNTRLELFLISPVTAFSVLSHSGLLSCIFHIFLLYIRRRHVFAQVCFYFSLSFRLLVMYSRLPCGIPGVFIATSAFLCLEIRGYTSFVCVLFYPSFEASEL